MKAFAIGSILLLVFIAAVGLTQTVRVPGGAPTPCQTNDTARDIVLVDKIHGKWLTVGRIDKSDCDAHGYNPSMTYILVHFKPIVKRYGPDRYQIMFTSEIAEDIP